MTSSSQVRLSQLKYSFPFLVGMLVSFASGCKDEMTTNIRSIPVSVKKSTEDGSDSRNAGAPTKRRTNNSGEGNVDPNLNTTVPGPSVSLFEGSAVLGIAPLQAVEQIPGQVTLNLQCSDASLAQSASAESASPLDALCSNSSKDHPFSSYFYNDGADGLFFLPYFSNTKGGDPSFQLDSEGWKKKYRLQIGAYIVSNRDPIFGAGFTSIVVQHMTFNAMEKKIVFKLKINLRSIDSFTWPKHLSLFVGSDSLAQQMATRLDFELDANQLGSVPVNDVSTNTDGKVYPAPNFDEFVFFLSTGSPTCTVNGACKDCQNQKFADGCWEDALFALTRPDSPKTLTVEFLCNTIWPNVKSLSVLAGFFSETSSECYNTIASALQGYNYWPQSPLPTPSPSPTLTPFAMPTMMIPGGMEGGSTGLMTPLLPTSTFVPMSRPASI